MKLNEGHFSIETVIIHFWINFKGAIHKGRLHIRGGGVQVKVDKCGQGERGWIAKCGHPLGKKNIFTIFANFTQMIWQHVCI